MKLSKIKLNPNNPRLIKDDRFEKLKKSIQEFPKMFELRPIVINDDNIVLGGNQRLRALKDLGFKDIPDSWVKNASELTEEEQRRFIIADNVGFGEHDWDILANEWDAEQLTEWGVDIPNFTTEDENDTNTKRESANFTIECESLEQLGDLQQKLDTLETQLKYNDFLIKVAL